MKYARFYEELAFPQLNGRFGTVSRNSVLEQIYSITRPDGTPALAYHVDPAPAYVNTAGALPVLRDRANGAAFVVRQGTAAPGTSLDGQPSLDISVAAPAWPDGFSSVNKNAWTLCMVFASTDTVATQQRLFGVGGSGGLGTGVLFPTLVVGPTGLNVREGGTNSTRLADSLSYLTGDPMLVMATFSVDKGLTLRRNGAQTGASTSDTRPLTFGEFSLYGDRGATNALTGSAGEAFAFHADLSADGYSAFLPVLENYLCTKYGITVGS